MNNVVKVYFACLFCWVGLAASSQTVSEQTYTRHDLGKARWIEGNWKGMDGNTPFYEIYKLVNDSTLEITSYEWNGTDSSKSSKAFVAWKDGHYYLGDNLNWKVNAIIEDAIFMVPHQKAANEILWKRKDENNWYAVLKSQKGEKLYHMERVNHFNGGGKKK